MATSEGRPEPRTSRPAPGERGRRDPWTGGGRTDDPPRPPTVVIGVGSPLMGDDGLGLVALEGLRSGWRFEPYVELVDGGTWGMNLLHFIEGADRVLILDAIDAGLDPGALAVLEREELPRFLDRSLSPHQVDLRDVLAVARFRGTLPAETVALGLQPDRVELHDGLSPLLEARLGTLLSAAVERLEAWGHAASPRSSDGSRRPGSGPCTR